MDQEPDMTDEIELVSDGTGVAVIGPPNAVEKFLSAEGLASEAIDLRRFVPTLSAAAGAAHSASGIAAASGRWVQLTEQSARLMTGSRMMTGSSADVSRTILTTANGKIANILEIEKYASLVANPAVLAGVAGIMAQIAMEQAMDEITEYLAVIDKKIDDILRAQKNAVLADMIGVGLMIDEAMTVRDQVGRVSEITWSKVQNASMIIARTQAYAIGELDGIAEKLEGEKNVGALAKLAKAAESEARDWIAVLARCIQLQDGVGVLELDRVLDVSPDEIDQHRLGLKTARGNRIEAIGQASASLLSRMAVAVDVATDDFKVLASPFKSRAVVSSTNQVAVDVGTFHGVLGIDGNHLSLEAKRWTKAAEGARDTVLEKGAEGVAVAARFGGDTLDNARKLVNRAAEGVARMTRSKPDDEKE